MVKVIWLLKRADHLTLDEFREWWIGHHAHAVRAEQAPHLGRYIVNVREDRDNLPGKPQLTDDQEPEWDGIAEQWFESEGEFRAVYANEERAARADALAHTSRLARLIVREWEY